MEAKTATPKYIIQWDIVTDYGYGKEVECSYYSTETTYERVKKDRREYLIAGAKTATIRSKRIINPDYNAQR